MSVLIGRPSVLFSTTGGPVTTTTTNIPLLSLQRSIPANAPDTIDAWDPTSVLALKWLIIITQPSTNTSQFVEVYAAHSIGTYSYIRYGKIGTLTGIELDVVSVGGGGAIGLH